MEARTDGGERDLVMIRRQAPAPESLRVWADETDPDGVGNA